MYAVHQQLPGNHEYPWVQILLLLSRTAALCWQRREEACGWASCRQGLQRQEKQQACHGMLTLRPLQDVPLTATMWCTRTCRAVRRGGRSAATAYRAFPRSATRVPDPPRRSRNPAASPSARGLHGCPTARVDMDGNILASAGDAASVIQRYGSRGFQINDKLLYGPVALVPGANLYWKVRTLLSTFNAGHDFPHTNQHLAAGTHICCRPLALPVMTPTPFATVYISVTPDQRMDGCYERKSQPLHSHAAPHRYGFTSGRVAGCKRVMFLGGHFWLPFKNVLASARNACSWLWGHHADAASRIACVAEEARHLGGDCEHRECSLVAFVSVWYTDISVTRQDLLIPIHIARRIQG